MRYAIRVQYCKDNQYSLWDVWTCDIANTLLLDNGIYTSQTNHNTLEFETERDLNLAVLKLCGCKDYTVKVLV